MARLEQLDTTRTGLQTQDLRRKLRMPLLDGRGNDVWADSAVPFTWPDVRKIAAFPDAEICIDGRPVHRLKHGGLK